MRRPSLVFAVLAWLALSASAGAQGFGAADVGKPAPDFSVTSAEGRRVDLSGLRGRPVVLEWTNEGCPYVRHAYASGVMQALQKRAAAEGAVWLTVVSSAPGKQGYMTVADVARWRAETGASPAEVILDPKGDLGRLYGAKATPDLYVVDKAGVLVYMGAIDDHPSARPDDARTAHNYLAAALDAVKTGRKPQDAVTQAYGCSVKY